jgi:hypothetical protein
MQSRLEDVLRDKERELKLHQKFRGLVRFCEEEIFPLTSVPLQRHIETLKEFIEKLIPEPRDRREEMFSGEVFALLCTLYFHDMGAVSSCGWTSNREILNGMEGASRALFLSSEIEKRLGMPEKASELINSLIFSVKKTPIEWELVEDTKKAIVRNVRILNEIFDFSHLIWDIFSADSSYSVLRRFQNTDLRLRFKDASLAVDSKEGVIFIECKPQIPYHIHVLQRIKEHVDARFKRFRESVNGRLGFQYRQIVWNIGESFEKLSSPPVPGLFPFTAFQNLPFIRWEETSQLLDRLFEFGHVIMVGDGTTGKTTMINSFVVPQLRHFSPNVIYAEIWDRPVHQIREAMDNAVKTRSSAAVDIISACRRLLLDGPCFFLIDGCERLKSVSTDEKEKFQRLVDFCIEHENAYLIVLGDKEDFFDWYKIFRKMSLSAIFEVSSLDRLEIQPPFPQSEIVPVEIFREKVDEMLEKVIDRNQLREVVSVLTGNGDKMLKRYSVEEIGFETCIPRERIAECLKLLQDKGFVRQQNVFDSAFYALSSRHLKEHLHKQLELDQFAEKRKIRQVLRHAGEDGQLLRTETLDRIAELKGRMMFTKKETGLIIASMVYHGRDCADFLEMAKRELHGFDGDPILSLLSAEDVVLRQRVIETLAMVRDEGLVNPLLSHLRNETDSELRMLMVRTFVMLGKRRTIIALMNALTEMDDKEAKEKTVDYISQLSLRKARELLIEIADIEKDPDVIDRIDNYLSKLEE